MSNGATVRLLSEPASAEALAPIKAGIEVGEAMADGVIALSQAMIEYRGRGVISVATKAAGAERIARLVEFHLRGEIDFDVARQQGRETLRARLAAERLDNAAASDAAIDGLAALDQPARRPQHCDPVLLLHPVDAAVDPLAQLLRGEGKPVGSKN